MAATHKNNRLALAAYLEKHVTDDQYDHGIYGLRHGHAHCAGGWAVIAGIGGLHYVNEAIFEDTKGHHLSEALAHVFGAEAVINIFNGDEALIIEEDKAREIVIQRLRAL